MTNIIEQSNTKETSKVKLASLSLIMGLTLVYIIGLAHPMALHNAAHDVRHSSAFPCH